MQQPVGSDFPRTALEFDERFSLEEACHAYLMKQRWPEGFRCPACGHAEALEPDAAAASPVPGVIAAAVLTAGTIFHGSRKPLRLWLKAMFLMAGSSIVG